MGERSLKESFISFKGSCETCLWGASSVIISRGIDWWYGSICLFKCLLNTYRVPGKGNTTLNKRILALKERGEKPQTSVCVSVSLSAGPKQQNTGEGLPSAC